MSWEFDGFTSHDAIFSFLKKRSKVILRGASACKGFVVDCSASVIQGEVHCL